MTMENCNLTPGSSLKMVSIITSVDVKGKSKPCSGSEHYMLCLIYKLIKCFMFIKLEEQNSKRRWLPKLIHNVVYLTQGQKS